LVEEVSQFGSSLVQNVGEVMAEPWKLFQPTKAISKLGALTSTSIEGVKTLATDTMGLATGAVGDIMKTSSDLVNVRSKPKPDGGVMQPARPLSELSNIGGKIVRSWAILASGTVGTGVNIAKKILWAGKNLLRKGLDALKK
jgi:hypothetical protein